MRFRFPTWILSKFARLFSLISPTRVLGFYFFRGRGSRISFGSSVRFSGLSGLRPQNQFSREFVVGTKRGVRNRSGPLPARNGERGRVGLRGAKGLVSLPRDSNTRRIKPVGNQTFQYPCSCRIYAIKRPLAVSFSMVPLSLHRLLLLFLLLSLSLSLFRALSWSAESELCFYRMFVTYAHVGGLVVGQPARKKKMSCSVLSSEFNSI